MPSSETIILTRDVEAALVPAGTGVVLKKGEKAHITQSLGGSYTVVVNGNMFRIGEADVDALGIQVASKSDRTASAARTFKDVELEVSNRLKTCYDPEIPVNIVDLGLVYSCQITPTKQEGHYRADVKMTLTAPGCGMGPALAEDVKKKLVSIEEIDDAQVELVWDPPWNQTMLSEAAKLKLGIY